MILIRIFYGIKGEGYLVRGKVESFSEFLFKKCIETSELRFYTHFINTMKKLYKFFGFKIINHQ